MSRNFSVFLLFLLGLLWGCGYSLARYAMTHGVAALGYAFWQTLGPTVLLLIISKIAQEKISFNRKYIVFYLITGLFGIAIPNSMMYFASTHLSSGLLSVLVNTTPLFTYLFAWCLAQESFSWLRLTGIITCVVGLVLVSIFSAGVSIFSGVISNKWMMLALLSPVSFAVTSVYAAKFRPASSNDVELATGMLGTAFILLLPIVLLTHSFYSLLPPWHLPVAVIVVEMALSATGYIVLFKLINGAGPVYFSLVSGVVALVGVFFGWLLFDENLSLMQGLAVLLVIIGVVLVSCKFQQPNKALDV